MDVRIDESRQTCSGGLDDMRSSKARNASRADVDDFLVLNQNPDVVHIGAAAYVEQLVAVQNRACWRTLRRREGSKENQNEIGKDTSADSIHPICSMRIK